MLGVEASAWTPSPVHANVAKVSRRIRSAPAGSRSRSCRTETQTTAGTCLTFRVDRGLLSAGLGAEATPVAARPLSHKRGGSPGAGRSRTIGSMEMGQARRTRGRIVTLCHSGLDSAALSREAERLIRSVIPFDRACWHNVDPATAMITTVYGDSAPSTSLLPRLDYGDRDVNQYADLAGQPRGGRR